MSQFEKFKQALAESVSLEEVEFEDQSFYPDYMVECYWDTGLNGIDWRGDSFSCQSYIDENGYLDENLFFRDLVNEIQWGLQDPERTSVIYIVC